METKPKYYKSVRFMEDRDENGHAYIFSLIHPGDYTYDGNWKLTVTQGAIDCDCGKGMYCPLIEQSRFFGKEK